MLRCWAFFDHGILGAVVALLQTFFCLPIPFKQEGDQNRQSIGSYALKNTHDRQNSNTSPSEKCSITAWELMSSPLTRVSPSPSFPIPSPSLKLWSSPLVYLSVLRASLLLCNRWGSYCNWKKQVFCVQEPLEFMHKLGFGRICVFRSCLASRKNSGRRRSLPDKAY